ncbi:MULTISPECIES: amino acid ABC transporter permease [Ochrobactrum]|jgi:polar amino acid transport system permease protein|uniref:Amino acid ABC transporter permease n=1 Tax=Ochrobactrum quorumnocens TaxID=271865 RepID=A0A5N1JT27_9HYPH|nr:MULTISPECIES: amino acid ABC transporter permease [Brucella/Ochrobactrum group]KAA9367337.1 amino acid ABC transporter permease [[Ochrobactrum] quorumnocens]MBD7992031.1 amino acid ABC transporter permease [Ochrobactrum gallinarum]MDH7793773.1 polar amino acid transport system permease protein [Ochrobactrum sp. AN78]
MSHPTPDVSAERARLWRAKNTVRTHIGRAWLTFAFAFLTLLATAQTIYSVATFTLLQGWQALPVLSAGIAMLAPPLLILWFAFQSLRLAQAAGVATDIYQGRAWGARASDVSWQAISYAIAMLLLCAGAWFLIVNDAAVSRTFFDVNLIIRSAPTVIKAFGTNILIFLVAAVLILVWALVIAIARTLPGKAGRPIRLIATFYSDLFRGLPAIITIYLIGFGLPLTGLPILKDLSSNAYAIIALTLTYGAYTSEVYRSGIESVHPSQIAAARSLGLSYSRTMRHVVIPLAVRGIIPPLMNNCISLQKDTALVAIIGTIDAFNQSKIIASNYFNLSAVTTVALLFILITIPQARFVDRLIERDRRKMRSGL